MLNHLGGKPLERVHLLLCLVEFPEQENDTEGAHDRGDGENGLTVYGNHILMYTLFLLSFFLERGTHTGSEQTGRLRNARVHTIYLSEV
jgi:hypothetical protein